MGKQRLRAIRGAITVDADRPDEIVQAARELTERVMAVNRIAPGDIVSIFFTTTPDLVSEFPAVGARKAGLVQTPLMCAQEIPVPGSQPRCIRLMMHAYMDEEASAQPVYLREAVSLRPDLVPGAPQDGGEQGEPRAGATARPRPALGRIEPYVPGKTAAELARERGVRDAVKLSSNENPLGPSPAALRAMAQASAGVNVYPDGASRALKRALAERAGLDEHEVVVGCGSDEIIRMLAEAYLNPGDPCVFADHTFSQYAFATRLMDAREVVVPLKSGVHDLDGFAKAVAAEKPVLCFVCNPNNPTGTYVSHRDVVRFLDAVAASSPHTLVVFDEAYFEYVDAPDFPDTVALLKEGRHIAVLRTFSKIYGLAGLRVGYGYLPAQVAAELEKIRPPFNVNSLAQAAALAALDDQAHVEASRAMNAGERARLTEAFERLGLYVYPSQANFLLVSFPGPSLPVYEELLARGVIVRGGHAFGIPEALRITIGTPEQNDRVIKAVAEAMSSVFSKGAKSS